MLLFALIQTKQKAVNQAPVDLVNLLFFPTSTLHLNQPQSQKSCGNSVSVLKPLRHLIQIFNACRPYALVKSHLEPLHVFLDTLELLPGMREAFTVLGKAKNTSQSLLHEIIPVLSQNLGPRQQKHLTTIIPPYERRDQRPSKRYYDQLTASIPKRTISTNLNLHFDKHVTFKVQIAAWYLTTLPTCIPRELLGAYSPQS